MRPKGVLVLGSNRNQKLTKALFDAGLVPIVRESMQGALEKLHHDSFAAILVDRASVDVDALEFVLNVRDIDTWTPIVVVGETAIEGNSNPILSQQNTLVLGEIASPDHLAAVLPDIFAEKNNRGD